MLITYNLPHVFHPDSDPVLDALTLRTMIDTLIVMNRHFLRESQYHGHAVPALYSSGVRYDRTVWWEPIPALYGRTYGDCKSLTGAYIAIAEQKKIICQPVFRWVKRPSGVKDYHILVQMPNGTFHDPSKVLGMPEAEIQEFYGPNSY